MLSRTNSISRAEWRFAWLVTGAVCLLILGTFIFGRVATPRDAAFLGVSASSPADNLIYFSYIEQARETGHAFFWNVFSQEPSNASFFSPLWALIGYAAGLFHLSTPTIFVFALVVAVLVYGLGVYWAFATFMPDVRWRHVAFVTMFLASGAGFLVAALPLSLALGADLTFIPGYVLPTLLHSPLQALSQVLLIVTFALFIQTERRQAPRMVLYGAVVLLALMHPYDLVPLFVACVGYATFFLFQSRGVATNNRTWKTLVGMGAVSVPIGVYFWSLRWLDVGIGGWLQQNATSSPAPVQMVLGFAPLIILAFVGVARQWPRRGRALILLALWAAVVPLLMYVPVPFQSRFANGYSVVLVALAAPVFMQVVQKYRQSSFLFWVAMFIVLFMPTTMYNYVSTFRRYSESAAVGHNSVYPSKDLLAAAEWLHSQPGGAFLSHYATSRVVAALSLYPAYQADSHQTLGYPQKAAAWEQLLANPRALQSFLIAHDLRYYVETPYERQAYPALHMAAVETLETAFIRPGVTVFQVKAPSKNTSSQ